MKKHPERNGIGVLNSSNRGLSLTPPSVVTIVAAPPAANVKPAASHQSEDETPPAAELPLSVTPPFSAFGSLTQFRDAQRMAAMLARSSIVPEHFRGDENLGNCVIALELANRIGVSILVVMQNLQPIQGKAAWSSQFLISCINACGRFSPLRYQMTGRLGEDNRGCIAWARDRTGELLESPEVTIKTAKDEGWFERLGSRWKTMPELMLRYRSATLFARLYAPDVTMGLPTSDEAIELAVEANKQPTRPNFEKQPSKPTSVPCPDGTSSRSAVSKHPNSPNHYDHLKALKGLIALSGHSEIQLLEYLCTNRGCDQSLTELTEVAQKFPELVVWTHDHWNLVEAELAQLRKGVAR